MPLAAPRCRSLISRRSGQSQGVRDGAEMEKDGGIKSAGSSTRPDISMWEGGLRNVLSVDALTEMRTGRARSREQDVRRRQGSVLVGRWSCRLDTDRYAPARHPLLYLNLYISGTISSLACLLVDGQSSKVITYGVRLHIDSVARGVN